MQRPDDPKAAQAARQEAENPESQATPMPAASSPAAASRPGGAYPRGGRYQWWLLGLLLVWGYLFVSYPPMEGLGFGVTLFELSAVGIAGFYLHLSGRRPFQTSWRYLVVLGLSALSFSFFENSGIQGQLFLVQFLLFALWLAQAASPGPLSPWGLWDGLTLLFPKPFTHLAQKGSALAIPDRGEKKTRGIWLGVAVTLPVLALATALLMGADQRFEGIINRLGGQLVDNLGEMLFRLIPAAIIALYLLSMILSAAYGPKHAKREIKLAVNPLSMGILVAALCLLYAGFLALQADTLARVWEGQGAGAINYSQIARDGFFELCAVALLNLGVFLCGRHLVREKQTVQRALLTALGGLTLLIIVTAILKMAAYMDLHGYTLLRVQTTWVMVSLFLAFAVLITAQWTKLKPFRWILGLLVVSVMAASYANIGGLVARGNVERYLKGTLQTFEWDHYWSFPYEAAPHLLRLERETVDPDVKAQAQRFLAELDAMGQSRAGGSGRRTQSVQQILAQRQVRQAVEDMGWEWEPDQR